MVQFLIFLFDLNIEGNPFIIRFKTLWEDSCEFVTRPNIEGNPFIIRFKTTKK